MAIADALLCPFAQTTASSPEVEVRFQTLVQTFLLRFLGDPRVGRARWQGVSEEARRVINRWLIASTLDAFFHILAKVALDQHWRYRRAFWYAYFQCGVISDAWVVLGPNAYDIARANLPADHHFAQLQHGNDGDQCILLLRIGKLIIGEWSHNGRCRIWKEKSSDAPKLHAATYSGKDLKNSYSTADQFPLWAARTDVGRRKLPTTFTMRLALR